MLVGDIAELPAVDASSLARKQIEAGTAAQMADEDERRALSPTVDSKRCILGELFNRWGAQLWGVSFFGLLPGNILAALLVEGSLLNTGMTLKQIYLLEVPVKVIINGIVWLLFALAFRFVKSARRARQ